MIMQPVIHLTTLVSTRVYVLQGKIERYQGYIFNTPMATLKSPTCGRVKTPSNRTL